MGRLTRLDRILLLCTRQAFGAEHREAVERLAERGAVPWPRLLATAERHGVLPIVGIHLRRCDPARVALPEPSRAALEVAVLENAAARELDAWRLAQDLARLREVELDAMLIKSEALLLGVYEKPWVVVSRDVDLALRPRPGWWKGKGVERSVRSELYARGVECDLDGHHDVSLGGLLPMDWDRIWREASPVVFRGVPAWTMSAEDLLVALCANACRKGFLRLKCLFDVAETLGRGGAIDPARLAALAREAHAEGIVYAALVTVRETLGVEAPPGALAALGLRRRRAAAIRALIRACLRGRVFDGAATHAFGAALALASLRPSAAVRSLLRAPGQRRWARVKRRRHRLAVAGRATARAAEPPPGRC